MCSSADGSQDNRPPLDLPSVDAAEGVENPSENPSEKPSKSPSQCSTPKGSVPRSPPKSPRSPFRVKDAQSMSLSWEDLVFEVPVADGICGKSTKRIIKNSSGHFKPGTLSALMGPSGAGKTSLMNVLAGRAPYGEIKEGKVVLNGLEAEPHMYQKDLAYVMQHDAMFATQTPREALHFTATLRLPEYTVEEREDIVNAAITALRLDKCADTVIGSLLIPGLSGGEKKRAAVAVELISSPSLIFLDEPTSGLDSQSAYELVMILRSLAESGCTIVCTIHQPSSEVFGLFQEVVFLRDGHVVYDGKVEQVIPYFESDAHMCRKRTNPADFAMRRLQTMEEAEMHELLAKKQPASRQEIKGVFGSGDVRVVKQAFVFTQLTQLVIREFRQLVRDTPTLLARFGMSMLLCLFVGCVYFQAGDDWGEDGNPASISLSVQSHFGCLVFISVNTMFVTAQPMVMTFPLERASFIREYATGTYGTTVYLIAKTLVDVPAAMLQQVIGIIVFYFLTGMNGNFAFMLLSISLFSAVTGSAALLLGAATSSAELAINILPGILMPQILFAGLFVSSDEIPVWLRWLQWIMPLKYGVTLLTIAEFAEGLVPTNRQEEVSLLINRSDVNRDNWYVYVLIMVGIFIFLRTATGILLKRRAQTFA